MNERERYFARVAPLLGEGLSRFRVRCIGDTHVAELLASCRLRSFPGASAPLREALTWRNGFERFDFADGHTDATLIAEAGEHACARWDGAIVHLTLPRDAVRARFVTNAVARELRDALLGRAAFPSGVRHYGDARWPFAVAAEAPAQASFAHAFAGQHVLVVGAGSVGSEIARLLAATAARLTIVDAAAVSVFNPQRQWFSTEEIGRAKVTALRDRIGAERVRAVPIAADATFLDGLLRSDRPDVCVLATGTHHHQALARVLSWHGVPHVACCAYPQARFFEVLAVDPAGGTPCYDCFRGHIHRGVQSRPALSDEVSQFLYMEPDQAKRDATYVDLVAEPASAIETGRVADVAMACVTELARKQRGAWFLRALADQTTCFIGGNTVDVRDGAPAYGISRPGQVVRLGLDDLAGSDRACETCGRTLVAAHALQLPATPDEDAALLRITT
ncbi:MAG: ThiF family adenylyltransferase [Deltaproteobacteria bacterium]|nr:ThiF family adenylyltransferase [Deltaproteobacteria bacterium]